MADTNNTVAVRLTGVERGGIDTMVQYVTPEMARLAQRHLEDEGYDVTRESLDALPDGVEFDIK